MIEKIVFFFHFLISMANLGASTDVSLPEPRKEYVDAIYLDVREIEQREGKTFYSVEFWVRNHTGKSHMVTVTFGGFDSDDRVLVSQVLSGLVEADQEAQFKGEGSVDDRIFMEVTDWRVQRVTSD